MKYAASNQQNRLSSRPERPEITSVKVGKNPQKIIGICMDFVIMKRAGGLESLKTKSKNAIFQLWHTKEICAFLLQVSCSKHTRCFASAVIQYGRKSSVDLAEGAK